MSEMIDNQNTELVLHDEKPVAQDSGHREGADDYILPQDYLALSRSIARVRVCLMQKTKRWSVKAPSTLKRALT